MSQAVKHPHRKLNRRMQRLEDKQRRDMTALRNEFMQTIALAVPVKDGGYLIPPSIEELFRPKAKQPPQQTDEEKARGLPHRVDS